MATIVRDIDGCDIAHEALILQEYSEEVKCAGWDPQLALATASSAATEEAVDSCIPLLSTAFPKCP